MPDIRNEIIDNLQIRGAVSGGGLGSLARAIRVAMTGATSGSNGIRFLSSTATAIGTTTNFTVSATIAADYINSDGDTLVLQPASGLGQCYIKRTTGVMGYAYTGGVLESTQPISVADFNAGVFAWVITRQTVSVAGSVVFYVNGVQLGSSVAIPASSPEDFLPAGTFGYLLGTAALRRAGSLQDFILYNRDLSAAEVLSLYNNGPALADIGASQTVFYAGNYSAGVDGVTTTAGTTLTGNIDSIDGENDWLRVERTGATGNNYCLLPTTGLLDKRVRTSVKIHNATGSGVSYFYIFYGGSPPIAAQQVIVAIPAGTTKTIELDAVLTRATTVAVAPTDVSGNNITVATGSIYYVKSVLIYKSGLTGWWDARDAQSDTGQILDSSGNKNHAMLPASGATVIGKPMSEARQVRWTNTWTGTQELQYIGGVNQAVLPAKAYIESIVGIVSGATVEDIIIGDGSSGNRYVTITTGLAAGTVTFTLANRTTDGTNLKLTVDPDANATMSIIWTVTYRILE